MNDYYEQLSNFFSPYRSTRLPGGKAGQIILELRGGRFDCFQLKFKGLSFKEVVEMRQKMEQHMDPRLKLPWVLTNPEALSCNIPSGRERLLDEKSKRCFASTVKDKGILVFATDGFEADGENCEFLLKVMDEFAIYFPGEDIKHPSGECSHHPWWLRKLAEFNRRFNK